MSTSGPSAEPMTPPRHEVYSRATMPRRRAADWSQPLTRQILLGSRFARTLADVAEIALAQERNKQQKATWQAIAGAALKAAEGGDIEEATTAIERLAAIERGGRRW